MQNQKALKTESQSHPTQKIPRINSKSAQKLPQKAHTFRPIPERNTPNSRDSCWEKIPILQKKFSCRPSNVQDPRLTEQLSPEPQHQTCRNQELHPKNRKCEDPAPRSLSSPTCQGRPNPTSSNTAKSAPAATRQTGSRATDDAD